MALKKKTKKKVEKPSDVMSLIKGIIKSNDRRFLVKRLYGECLKTGLYKNIFDLLDELRALRAKKVLTHIGGDQWCVTKEKNRDPQKLISKIKRDLKKGK